MDANGMLPIGATIVGPDIKLTDSQGPSLGQTVSRLKATLRNAHTGPLEFALTVTEKILPYWDELYASETGLTYNQWINSTFGRGITAGYVATRREAIDGLGREIVRNWNHAAAVWAHNNVADEDMRQKLNHQVCVENRRTGSPPSHQVVMAMAKKLGWRTARAERACARCAEKDAEIASLKSLTTTRE